jgi:rhodanese-related sulfurtransferase
VKLVDVRSREEFEAMNIAGSALLSQDVMRHISWVTVCRMCAVCAAALMLGRRKWTREFGDIN